MKARPVDENAYQKAATRESLEPLKSMMETGTYSVTRHYGKKEDGSEIEEIEDRELKVRSFAVEPARVDIELGRTMNLGSYESARIFVRVSVPCYREELEEAYKFAHSFAKDRVDESANKIHEYVKNKSRY
jgi:hypothetical protein